MGSEMSLDTSQEKEATEIEPMEPIEPLRDLRDRDREDERHIVARGAPRRGGGELDQSAVEALKLFVTLVALTAAMAILVQWLF